MLEDKYVDWEVGLQGIYRCTNLARQAPLGPLSSSDVEWDITYKVQLVATDFSQTSQNLFTILSVEILEPIDLDLTFNWDWISQPKAPSPNVPPPSSSDIRISAGFGVDF